MGRPAYELVDMEEEDGTCLLDVLCDPQALNDFLHGTNELQNEDLLIACSSGEPSSLFTDTPSPVSLLADDITSSEDTPPAGCMDLSFLEEALLGSPEGGKGDTEEEGEQEEEQQEEEMACDILQQSLQEADITEHTMALEAGLIQPGPGEGHAQSLYTPSPPGPALLPPPAAVPFLSKPLPFPQPHQAPPTLPPMPRDTQAAVEPPQPSLLAVGPGCPSLKPAITQLMGLLPGNVFPAPPPETSFSLTPAQASSTSFSLIQKAVPSLTGLTGHPLLAPTIRGAAAPGIFLQRGPLPIQPKLPISIQPRLVQISPKPPGPPGQNTSPGLTFLPGTPSSNILLSPPPLCSKPIPQPPPQQAPHLNAPHLTKPQPLSLQLVSQGGGSFLIQPQGLFHGQNQFLLPSQSPVTLSQLPGSAARPLFTPGRQGAPVQPVQGVSPSAGHHLLDGSQILTAVPHHRQLNFSPHTVFTTATPSGQLSLRPGTLLSGPLQLQTGPPTVFQMPTQLAGAYAPQRAQGPGAPGRPQHATLLHSPALGNIALMHSGMQLASSHPDSHMTSISILNAPPAVVQAMPFTPQTARPLVGTTDGQISVQQASVVLLPDRAGPGEKGDNSPHVIQSSKQPFQHHASPQPSTAELQAASPVLTLLEALQALDPPGTLPKHLLDPAGSQPKHFLHQTETKSGVEEIHSTVTHNQSQDFIHQLQQQALTSPSPIQWPEVLAGTVALSGQDPDTSPLASEMTAEPPPPIQPVVLRQAASLSMPCPSMVLASPLHPETEEANLPGESPTLLCASPPGQGLGSTPQPERCLETTSKQDSFTSPLGLPGPGSGPGITGGQTQTGVYRSPSPLSVRPYPHPNSNSPQVHPAVFGSPSSSTSPLAASVPQEEQPDHLLETLQEEQPDHLLETLQEEQPDHLLETLQEEQPDHLLETLQEEQPDHLLETLQEEQPDHLLETLQEEQPDHLLETLQEEQPDHLLETLQEEQADHFQKTVHEEQLDPLLETSDEEQPDHLQETFQEEHPNHLLPTPLEEQSNHLIETTLEEHPKHLLETTLEEHPNHLLETSLDEQPNHLLKTPLDEHPNHLLETSQGEQPNHLLENPLEEHPNHLQEPSLEEHPNHLLETCSNGEVDQANQHHAVQQHIEQSTVLAMDMERQVFIDVHPPSPRLHGNQGPQGPQTHRDQDQRPQAHSQYNQGSQAHSQYNQGPQVHTLYGQGTQAHSQYDQGTQAHSQYDQGPQAHSQYDQAPQPHSQYDQGPQAHSQYDQGPQAHSQYDPGTLAQNQHDQGPQDHSQYNHRPQAHREHDQWLRAVQTAQQMRVKVAGPVAVEREQRYTQAMRKHRFHQQLWQDQEVVKNPQTCSSFSSVEEAVTHLLPYHTCARHLPGLDHFDAVDEQFDSVSGFLLKRTKDMLNRYRQLLLGEALQVMPSAEMVMLDRLFLQSERFSLAEDRKMARRDPESFLMALHASESPSAGSSRVGLDVSRCPPSNPAWTRLSDRPPGLRTYCSSSRGGLRLTIKHQSGSRKVIHNSACDTMQHSAPSAHKRDYSGQPNNGSGVLNEQNLQGSSHRTSCLAIGEITSKGAPPPDAIDVPHVACDNGRTTVPPTKTAGLDSQYGSVSNTHTTPSLERQTDCLQQPSPDQEMSAPKLKRFRPTPQDIPFQEDRPSPRPKPPDLTSKAGGPTSPDLLCQALQPGYRLEACPGATPPHLGENALNEHLQSAINSILELQRLQGPTAAGQPRLQGACQTTGPTSALDQALTSILQGRL
ncbi:BRD4-interacting chromatin-remodeling complex-associated protein isoform X2 [Esox lucius]|uniref:BRD4-interacting chromatin-remodeling complex-associated protein isoform X2 n=1 Tax=Esox lucius TaxID=8010 RepID=UPI0014769D9B|nr:BRD4-interacting chromatin-remodeling complex-associated protein isoform X2 [Esox lucius]